MANYWYLVTMFNKQQYCKGSLCALSPCVVLCNKSSVTCILSGLCVLYRWCDRKSQAVEWNFSVAAYNWIASGIKHIDSEWSALNIAVVFFGTSTDWNILQEKVCSQEHVAWCLCRQYKSFQFSFRYF